MATGFKSNVLLCYISRSLAFITPFFHLPYFVVHSSSLAMRLWTVMKSQTMRQDKFLYVHMYVHVHTIWLVSPTVCCGITIDIRASDQDWID